MTVGQQQPLQQAADILVGTAGDPRVVGYQAARARSGLPPAALLDYRDLITDPDAAAVRIPDGARVRIDSPGRNTQVLAGLLAHGIDKSLRLNAHHLRSVEIERRVGERGRLLPPRQLYFGMERVLGALTRRAAHSAGAGCRHDPARVRQVGLPPAPGGEWCARAGGASRH